MLSKWWGAYRVVPALVLLPAISSVIIAAGGPEQPVSLARAMPRPAPIDAIDRIAFVVVPVALLLAQGAVVTSVGLALATWFRRVGRAVGVSVTLFTFFAFAWLPALEIGIELLDGLEIWPESVLGSAEFFMGTIGAACPSGSQILTFEAWRWPPSESRLAFYIAQGIVCLAILGSALVVLALAMATFNRCVGRAPERPRRAPRPPRRMLALAGMHAKPSVIAQAVSAS